MEKLRNAYPIDSPRMIVMHKRSRGFTLIELVVTMMIIGILAVAAISRFSGTQDFDRRGFHDETLSALRYAQKAAIAQRRNVCVTFIGLTTVTFSIADTPGIAAVCNTPLVSPTGVSPFVVTPRIAGSALFALAPTNFQFDGLGRASLGQDIQITGVSQRITIELETGYVRPNPPLQ